VQLRYIHK